MTGAKNIGDSFISYMKDFGSKVNEYKKKLLITGIAAATLSCSAVQGGEDAKSFTGRDLTEKEAAVYHTEDFLNTNPGQSSFEKAQEYAKSILDTNSIDEVTEAARKELEYPNNARGEARAQQELRNMFREYIDDATVIFGFDVSYNNPKKTTDFDTGEKSKHNNVQVGFNSYAGSRDNPLEVFQPKLNYTELSDQLCLEQTLEMMAKEGDYEGEIIGNISTRESKDAATYFKNKEAYAATAMVEAGYANVVDGNNLEHIEGNKYEGPNGATVVETEIVKQGIPFETETVYIRDNPEKLIHPNRPYITPTALLDEKGGGMPDYENGAITEFYTALDK